MHLKSCDTQLFFSRNDNQDPRLGDFAQASLKADTTHVIWGYPDDEGIRLNGGRPGAAKGPEAIRKTLYKLTPPVFKMTKSPVLGDLGDIDSEGYSLDQRHEFARSLTAQHTAENRKFISLGGGHDYGYSDACGFMQGLGNQEAVIINFDAHLDVRPLDQRGPHSGTPFYRLLNEYSGPRLHFFEVGIQEHCNSQNHLKWATEKGAHVFSQQSLRLSMSPLIECLRPFHGLPLFVSFDIDCLHSAEAPGCSQSWPVGLSLTPLLHLFDELSPRFQWRGLGVYEVAPPLDVDNVTAKAAALLVHKFIFSTL